MLLNVRKGVYEMVVNEMFDAFVLSWFMVGISSLYLIFKYVFGIDMD
jgi:hypothetical protein